MNDFAFGFLIRAAVMLPALMIATAGIWLAMKKLGFVRLDQPFDKSDMRTWPLSYAMRDSVIFGLVFAAAVALLGNAELSAAAATLMAAFAGAIPTLKPFFEN